MESACGLLQMFHRTLCFSPPPVGAGLDPAREIRRDLPLPPSGGPRAEPGFFVIYLDGFTDAEFVHWAELARLSGKSPAVNAVAEAWKSWGIPTRDDKTVSRELECQSLGCRVDGGPAGVLAPPRKVNSELLSMTAWFCNGEKRSLLQAQVLGGRWVRNFQFRKEVSCVFGYFWRWMQEETVRTGGAIATEAVIEDLLLAVCWMPLMAVDLRARISPLVVASDASEEGMGVCRTSSLTNLCTTALSELRLRRSTAGDELGLVEVFSGIGAGRRAIERLHLKAAAYLACDLSEDARRVVTAAWPEVEHRDSVAELSGTALAETVRGYASVKMWLVVGGFPCQRHSALNANRRDFADERALHPELLRVAEQVAAAVPDAIVKCLGECVASMDPPVRDCISQDFGVRPLEICPSNRIPMRRSRYYLANWQVRLSEGVELEPTENVDRIHMPPPTTPVPDELWADRGWTRAGTGPLPTFLQSFPRRQPGDSPAGLEQCDTPTRQRWKEHAYRYPPYQYKYQHGMVNGTQWRPPSATERETLLGFRAGHTAVVMTPAQAKGREEEREDRRLCLLGNSIQTGVLAWILGWLLHEQGFLPAPPAPTLVDVAGEEEAWGNEAGVELVRALLDRQTHRGRDIRHWQPLCHPSVLPRDALKSAWWKWRVVFGAPWLKGAEHINLLELRAFLAAIQWRTRSKANVRTRGLQMMDSLVVLGAVAKGRSPSPALAPVLTRVNALMLAASYCALVGWVRTDDNPADAPSRRNAKW